MSHGFVALLSANIVVLACWTVIDPLTYVREAHQVLTAGIASFYLWFLSVKPRRRYLIPLAFVNLSVLVIANWQAYVSRVVESEFAESSTSP
jgi:hypothetical protein